MIRINLLPFRDARKKEDVRRQVSYFLLLLVLVLLGFLAIHWYQGSRVNSLEAKVERIENDIKKYEAIGKQVDENKVKIELINKKKRVIADLVKDRYKPARLLGVMTELVVSDQMWLTSLSTQGDNVRVKGVAMDERTVADFMTNLERSGLFPIVNLNTVKQKTFNDSINLKEFEVSCQTKIPEPVQDKPKRGRKK